jgi:hypothetical protein
MNLIILNNRQTITQYLVALRAVVLDCSENLKNYYQKFGFDWNQSRFKFTFGAFSIDVQVALDVEAKLATLFTKFSETFQNMVRLQEESVA